MCSNLLEVVRIDVNPQWFVDVLITYDAELEILSPNLG
jgi:hypothetical protein